MATRVAGTCYLKVDGTQYELKDDAIEIPLSKVSREAVMALGGLAGFKEMAQRQFVKFTSVFVRDLPIQTITNTTNATLVVEYANGKTYTLTGAYLEGEILADGVSGDLPLEFTGTKGIWR